MELGSPLIWWVGFNVVVLALLALDLGVFHRHAHVVRFREALVWSAVWVALALLFNLGILLGWFGPYDAAERAVRAKEFFVGYVMEKSLSVDNVFVFAMIFSFFAVPAQYQHRVLFYGIVGALLLRALFIFSGVWLIERFEWVLYVFALFLVATGVKMLWAGDRRMQPDRNPVVRLMRRLMPVTADYVGARLVARIDGRLHATPLLLVLVLIETSDVIFAIDSIPAILIITQDPFIVYTSNVLAILGLRALYFALAGFMKMFRYLSYGLALILMFIGGKMFYQAVAEALTGVEHKLAIEWSLGVIVVVLAASVAASLLRRPPTACAG